MSSFEDTSLVLALSADTHVTIFARHGTLAAGARLYRAVVRVPTDGPWQPLVDRVNVTNTQIADALAQRAALDAEAAPANVPWQQIETAPAFDFAQDRQRCLTLCLRAELQRFALEAQARLAPVLAAPDHAPPAEVIAGLEAALDLDLMAPVLPLLPRLSARLAQLKTARGNPAYALRLIADCADRAGDAPLAIAALRASCALAENGQKLARLAQTLAQEGHLAEARDVLARYRSRYRMGPALRALEAQLTGEDRRVHGP